MFAGGANNYNYATVFWPCYDRPPAMDPPLSQRDCRRRVWSCRTRCRWSRDTDGQRWSRRMLLTATLVSYHLATYADTRRQADMSRFYTLNVYQIKPQCKQMRWKWRHSVLETVANQPKQSTTQREIFTTYLKLSVIMIIGWITSVKAGELRTQAVADH